MPKTMTRSRAKQHSDRFVLVGSNMRKVSPDFVVCRSADLAALVHAAARKRVFVSANQNATENLLTAGLRVSHGSQMGELLTLEAPRPDSVPPSPASSSASSVPVRVTRGCPSQSS